MDDIADGLNDYPESNDDMPAGKPASSDPLPAKEPYHRQTPHITQAPIDDVEPNYVTRERYVTLEQARGGRKHMGTATSDPQYLSPTEYENSRRLSHSEGSRRSAGNGAMHYERYLQTPKPGKSIFTSRRDRARKRNRRLIFVAVIVIVAAILLKIFVFH